MTTEKKQMFTRRITQANKTQLTVIVYEMLSAYLEDARAAHDAGQTEELVQNIDLARACIGQLRSSQHPEPFSKSHSCCISGKCGASE